MTNREFYKEEILNIACSGNKVAIDKDGKLCACDYHILCLNCALGNTMTCKENFEKWCNKEYVEPCPFEKDELVEVSNDGQDYCLRYFSHMSGGYYFAYVCGNKSTDVVTTVWWKYCRKYGTLGGLVKEKQK